MPIPGTPRNATKPISVRVRARCPPSIHPHDFLKTQTFVDPASVPGDVSDHDFAYLALESMAQAAVGRDALTPVTGETAARAIDLAVEFGIGTSKLTDTARRQLDELAAALASRQLVPLRVSVAGHTDVTGKAARNKVFFQGKGGRRGRIPGIGASNASREFRHRRLALGTPETGDGADGCRQLSFRGLDRGRFRCLSAPSSWAQPSTR